MAVEYSICVTNYNSVQTIKESLDSLLSQLDRKFEVIVVDNESNDGSLEVLAQYARDGKIKLIVKRCSRGLGRQIGVEASRGKYIIGQVDMDEVFEPKLKELLTLYHKRCDGCLLVVQGAPGVTVMPKELVHRVGGYRDLNYLEDADLSLRVTEIGECRYLRSFRIIQAHLKTTSTLRARLHKFLAESFFSYRALFRLHDARGFLRTMSKTTVFSSPFIMAAFVAHWFCKRYPRHRCFYVKKLKRT